MPRTAIVMVAALLTAACAAPPRSPKATVKPTATASGIFLDDPTGIAFDRAGNLWVANYRGNSLLMYGRPDIGRSGSPRPLVVIAGAAAGLQGPNRIAFDNQGQLWVVNYDGNTVVAFTSEQLRSSPAPKPTVVLGAGTSLFNQPTGLAFDGAGDLWVTEQGGDDAVEISSRDLVASGSPPPVIRLAHPGGDHGILEAAAFDQSGALWLARYFDNRVIEIDPDALRRSGSPAVARELDHFTGPIGLAIDGQGRLWVAAYNGAEITREQLGATQGGDHPLTISGASIRGPHTPAIDPMGNLWVTCSDADTVVMFSADRLRSGTVTSPSVTLG